MPIDLADVIDKYAVLEVCKGDISAAFDLLLDCFRSDRSLFTCGNGGSAADSTHIAGELVKGFLSKRPLDEEKKQRLAAVSAPAGGMLAEKLQGGLKAFSLCENLSLTTAVANDIGAEYVYAQQVAAYGREGDVLLCISTSGNAENVALAALTAKAFGIKTIGLTGEGGGKLAEICDVCIKVPERETYKIQELHLPVYHYLCAAVEDSLFEKRVQR